MNEFELLRALGVTEAEAHVYLSLLQYQSASIRQIAAETSLNRGKTYESLQSLTQKGLVGFKRQGERRKFFAENPNKLRELIAERSQRLKQLEETADDVIPQLLSKSVLEAGSPTVRFFEDVEGVVTILRDVLNTVGKLETKEYYAYSSPLLRKYIYTRFPNFTRRRIKENISVKVIAIGKGGEPAENSERKWISEADSARSSSYSLIYGNKVALISVSGDQTPYGVVVEETGVAAMQKLLFENLWNKLS